MAKKQKIKNKKQRANGQFLKNSGTIWVNYSWFYFKENNILTTKSCTIMDDLKSPTLYWPAWTQCVKGNFLTRIFPTAGESLECPTKQSFVRVLEPLNVASSRIMSCSTLSRREDCCRQRAPRHPRIMPKVAHDLLSLRLIWSLQCDKKFDKRASRQPTILTAFSIDSTWTSVGPISITCQLCVMLARRWVFKLLKLISDVSALFFPSPLREGKVSFLSAVNWTWRLSNRRCSFSVKITSSSFTRW